MKDDERQRATSASKHQAQNSIKQRPTLDQVKPAVAIRDERRCQLTHYRGMGCEVANIIPSKLDSNVLEQHYFDDVWNWLKAFWEEKKVSKWQELIAKGSEMSVHQAHNLITLDMKIHHFWDHGLVALRPVSRNKDETEMQIAFHWLPPKERFNGRSQNDGVRVNAHPLKDPRFRPVETPGDNYYIAFRREDGSVNLVTSGDIFTLKTTDKKERPLPSFDLLELRWHLSRPALQSDSGEARPMTSVTNLMMDTFQGPFQIPILWRHLSPLLVEYKMVLRWCYGTVGPNIGPNLCTQTSRPYTAFPSVILPQEYRAA